MTRRLAVAVLVVAAVSVHGTLHGQDRAPQNESIRKEDLRADVFFLAGDAMRGRLVDTPENRLAADFIKSRFERLALKPVGADGSFFHPFDMVTTTLGPGNEMKISPDEGASWRPAEGKDFYAQRFSGSAHASGPLVFAGFGMSWPEKGHEDFPADLVKGTIVLVLAHEPGERDPNSPFEGVVTSERAVAWRKALAAQQKGAARHPVRGRRAQSSGERRIFRQRRARCGRTPRSVLAPTRWPSGRTRSGFRRRRSHDRSRRASSNPADVHSSSCPARPTRSSGYPPLQIPGTVVQMTDVGRSLRDSRTQRRRHSSKDRTRS